MLLHFPRLRASARAAIWTGFKEYCGTHGSKRNPSHPLNEQIIQQQCVFLRGVNEYAGVIF